MSSMEQLADDYESTRSTGSYVSITGQPTRGKSKGGGQSIGQNDIYSLLTFNAQPILKELISTRSDNIKAKREMINNIHQYGKTDLSKIESKGKTRDLFNNLMIGMGLSI